MTLLQARVQEIRYQALDVISIRLAPLASPFPAWTAGSHIDLHLPNGMMRSYSLSNQAPAEAQYQVTVQRNPAWTGGSNWLHESLRVGQIIAISPPRNHFSLVEDAHDTVFIAGGIGITPFLPMARRLSDLGRRWKLYYSVRTPERAAHLEELEAIAAQGLGEIEPHFDGIPGGMMLDIHALVRSADPRAHLYCCGPEGMLKAFRAAAGQLPSERIHFEYFSAHIELANTGGYVVELARSGRQITVAAGETILSALLKAGVHHPYFCQSGFCGVCQVRVLAGTPDHRGMLLSESERQEGKMMLICCSGSKTGRLVLDL